MPALAYHRALWIHQMDQLGEKTIEEAAATALQYAGADTLLLKVFDQSDYMSTYDTAPDAVSSIQKFHALQQRAESAGVTLLPWVVPGNHTQAQVHGILAPSPVIVDLEPYKGFWQDTPNSIVTYLSGLRAADVEEVYVSIDPRSAAETALDLGSWAHLVDGLLPQLYWTDFQQAEASIVPQLDQELDALGVPVYPVYPYNASAFDLSAAWADAQQDYMPTGCSLWRMGSATGQQLRNFASLALPTKLTPRPQWDNNATIQTQRLLMGESTNNYQPDVAGAIAFLQRFLPAATV